MGLGSLASEPWCGLLTMGKPGQPKGEEVTSLGVRVITAAHHSLWFSSVFFSTAAFGSCTEMAAACSYWQLLVKKQLGFEHQSKKTETPRLHTFGVAPLFVFAVNKPAEGGWISVFGPVFFFFLTLYSFLVSAQPL